MRREDIVLATKVKGAARRTDANAKVNLGRESSEQVARELINRGTPVVTTSGYSREQMPAIMQAAPLVGKPVGSVMLTAEI